MIAMNIPYSISDSAAVTEAVCEQDDALLEQYLSGEELQTIISLMDKADDDQKTVLLGIINKFGKR